MYRKDLLGWVAVSVWVVLISLEALGRNHSTSPVASYNGRELASHAYQKCSQDIDSKNFRISEGGKVFGQVNGQFCELGSSALNHWVIEQVKDVEARKKNLKKQSVRRVLRRLGIPVGESQIGVRPLAEHPPCNGDTEITRKMLSILPSGALLARVQGVLCRPRRSVVDWWVRAWVGTQSARKAIAQYPQVTQFLTYYLSTYSVSARRDRVSDLVRKSSLLPKHSVRVQTPTRERTSKKTTLKKKSKQSTHVGPSQSNVQGSQKGRATSYQKMELLKRLDESPPCKNAYLEDVRGSNKKYARFVEECEPFSDQTGKTYVVRKHFLTTNRGMTRFLNDRDKFKAGRIRIMDGNIQPNIGSIEVGIMQNGKEHSLEFSKYIPRFHPEETFYLEDITYFGVKNRVTRGSTAKFLVADIVVRQNPKKTGIPHIDADRAASLRRFGRLNEHVDFLSGKIIYKIEDDRICPVAGLRMELRRTDLLRITRGKYYHPRNRDYYGEHVPNQVESDAIERLVRQTAKARFSELIQRAPSLSCDSVTTADIHRQLERPIVDVDALAARR